MMTKSEPGYYVYYGAFWPWNWKRRFVPYYENGQFISPLSDRRLRENNWGKFAWLPALALAFIPPIGPLIFLAPFMLWCRRMEKKCPKH